VFISDEDFDVIYEALRLVNTVYTHEEVAHVVAMEGKAWDVVQRVRDTADQPG
jgi:hypothetical protein